MEYIRAKVNKDEGCVFCIKSNENDDRDNLVLFRGKTSFVLMNYYPYNNGHIMVCPYNHVEETETLTAGLVRYASPTDSKTIDFDSFRIKRNDTLGNETKKLRLLSYEEYLEKYSDYEYNGL